MNKHARTLSEWAEHIINSSIKTDRDCWEFRRRTNQRGYGSVYVTIEKRKINKSTHKLVYEQLCGPVPPGMFVCHKCDNPLCCNPAHLFISDCKGNARDMVEKGRGKTVLTWGPINGNHKLTTEQVYSIRSDSRFLRVIASEYGVTKSTISQIKNGKSRKYE